MDRISDKEKIEFARQFHDDLQNDLELKEMYNEYMLRHRRYHNNIKGINMTFITTAQLMQIGRKCSICEEKAKWLDKFDENMPAYCDKHFPGRVCECEICNSCQESLKTLPKVPKY